MSSKNRYLDKVFFFACCYGYKGKIRAYLVIFKDKSNNNYVDEKVSSRARY